MKQLIFLSFVAIIIFAGCANQMIPGGGEIDSVPPDIVSHFPENGSVMFSEDYLEFEFSEYVDKRTVKESFFISPAPEESPEFEWSGKYVRVYFPRPLKDSVTYSVSLGTDIADLNNGNKMAQSFNLYFSTGSKIDKGAIAGRIEGEMRSGISLFAYKNVLDTLNPSYNRPDYLTQSGTDGAFILSGLAAGTYTIFAVKDEYKDLLYQAEQDLLGVPTGTVIIGEGDTVKGVNFIPEREDTSKPRLLSAVMTDRDHILVGFSTKVNSELAPVSAFTLRNSDNGTTVPITALLKGKAKEQEIVLIPADTVSIFFSWQLITSKITDIFGNSTENDTVTLLANEAPDTNRPQLLKMTPSQNDDSVDMAQKRFQLHFDDYIGRADPTSFMYFGDTSGNTIRARFVREDGSSVSVYPDSMLPSLTRINLGVNYNMLRDRAGNFTDTTMYYSVVTLNELEYTGVLGNVLPQYVTKHSIIKLENIVKKEIVYTGKTDSLGNFSFERIIPGRYRLYLLDDADGNGVFTQGSLRPRRYSEKIIYHKEAFTLPPRWIVTDLFFTPEE